MEPTTPRQYQMPTHLSVPDKIDIPLLGVTISLTMRQGVMFLFGWSTAFAWWHRTTSWQTSGELGCAAHWLLPGALALLVFIVAMLQIQGRSCEQWCMIVFHYLTREKVFVWQSVAGEHLATQQRTREMDLDLLFLPEDEETDQEKEVV